MSEYTPDQVRQAITRRIAARAVPDTYGQGTDCQWRESAEPLVPEFEPDTRAHLAFFVDDRETVNTGLGHGIEVDGEDEGPRLGAPMTVRFLFCLRPGDAVADWDRSVIAASDLLGWLIDESWLIDAGPEGDDLDIVIRAATNPIRRAPVGNNGERWLAVSLSIVVVYTLSLAEAA